MNPKVVNAVLALTLCSCVGTGGVPDSSLSRNNALDVVPREAWGWQDGPGHTIKHRVERITIHHGGSTYADDRDPREYLRALQSWSRSDKGWADIPYHFVIDLDGNIYEARPLDYPGDTNTSYDPTGHALIQVVGNYEKRVLADEQLTSIIALSAMLASRYDVPVGDVRGHLDYAPGETSCPGENLYQYFRDNTISNRMAEIMSSPTDNQ